MSSTLPIDKAIEALSDLSRKYENKIIIDPEDRKSAIGVNIVNMHWFDALETILKSNNLICIGAEDHYLIKSASKEIMDEGVRNERAMFASREVMISVLFFELNTSKLEQLGTSWNFLSSGSDAFTSTAADNKLGLFQIDLNESMDLGDLTASLKAMSNNQLGEILASPQITVRSGREGKIQIGSDFSIATKDFSGNTVAQFFSTGSIITVTPQIVTVDSTTFINLDLEVQKSNANNSELGIEVKKTSAQTSILLLNGEETMIGGLYYNELSGTREGIPILKDLPWWAFGIRYLAGYQTTSKIRKELILILRAELLPSLKERVAARRTRVKEPRILEQGLQNIEKKLDAYLDQSGTIK
jgi:type IV pilus assembly protein PilQ